MPRRAVFLVKSVFRVSSLIFGLSLFVVGGLGAGGGRCVLLQCLFDRFGSVFPQCGLMVFPGVVIVSR